MLLTNTTNKTCAGTSRSTMNFKAVFVKTLSMNKKLGHQMIFPSTNLIHFDHTTAQVNCASEIALSSPCPSPVELQQPILGSREGKIWKTAEHNSEMLLVWTHSARLKIEETSTASMTAFVLDNCASLTTNHRD